MDNFLIFQKSSYVRGEGAVLYPFGIPLIDCDKNRYLFLENEILE